MYIIVNSTPNSRDRKLVQNTIRGLKEFKPTEMIPSHHSDFPE